MFSQIEINKYYQDKLSKETLEKQKLYHPKLHLGQSKYREDWYNQQRIVYPKKNIFDKVKQKQEIYKFRQNGDNFLKMKSSIHGSAKKVNLDLYFKPIEEYPIISDKDYKYYYKGSADNSPERYEGNSSSQQLPYSPRANSILPPIRSGNGLDQYAVQTPQRFSDKGSQKSLFLSKNYSQPNFTSNYQQYQQNQQMQYQQSSPTNKSQHNHSLFLTKQQNQSDIKINSGTKNYIASNTSEYNYEDANSEISNNLYINQSHQRKRFESIGSISSPSQQQLIPKIQILNIRDNSTPNPTKSNDNNSLFYQEQSLTPTPYGDNTSKTRRSQSNFSRVVEGQDDMSLASRNVSNQSKNSKKGGKGKKDSQPEIQLDQLTPIQKFDFLMNSLNDIQQRFVVMVESDNELIMIFENLITIKLTEIAKILAYFFRFCMERLIFRTNSKGQQNSITSTSNKSIGSIDARVFKKLTISQGLVKPLENFFASELEKVSFHKEVAKFRLIWKELCEKYLLVHNLLLEIGGIRRMKVILQNIADKLQKHYTIKFSSSQMEEMFNFSQAIFQDNTTVMSSSLLKYRQQLLKNKGTLNFQRVNFVDLFIIKHFVFLELAKEEYIPWESKLILLQKLEAFRFDNFRDLYNLPDSKDIATHLLNFAPSALLDQLPYKSAESLRTFFSSLAENMLGSGNSLQLIEIMTNEGVSTSYNNIIMMEHLMKSSITADKDIPQIIRKIIEHKFITLKRNMKIFTNFNSIIIKADEIVNKMNTMNIILIKYLNIPKEEHKLYLDMNLFYQVLVEACSQLDAFSLQDLQYGMKYYNFQKKHYFFWIKSIKRVLLEMKYTIGDVQNLAIHLEKIYDDSTL